MRQLKPLEMRYEYPSDYKENCFLLWYKLGRISCHALLAHLPVCEENGLLPGENTLGAWKKDFSWDFRGDTLDARVSEIVAQSAITEKVEMLKRQSNIAVELQDVGLTYFREYPVTNQSVALKMILQGAELERMTRGMPDAMIKVAEMQNEDLGTIVRKLMSRASVSDMEIKPEAIDDIIEAVTEDVD